MFFSNINFSDRKEPCNSIPEYIQTPDRKKTTWKSFIELMSKVNEIARRLFLKFVNCILSAPFIQHMWRTKEKKEQVVLIVPKNREEEIKIFPNPLKNISAPLESHKKISKPVPKEEIIDLKKRRQRIYESPVEACNRMDKALQEANKHYHLPKKDHKFTLAKKEIGSNQSLVAELGLQGVRSNMEDELLITNIEPMIENRKTEATLYALFDGHGGIHCAQFLKKNLANYLVDRIEKHCKTVYDEANLLSALKMTMVDLDDAFQVLNKESGSTAIIALLLKNYLYVINVGDSRAVLSLGDKCLQLSEDAKPSNPKFLKGIEKRQGWVAPKTDKVCGFLAVARSIGDHFLEECINPRPKISRIPLDQINKNESTLILASDGLWDVVGTEKICKLAHTHRYDKTAEQLVFGIVQGAIHSGSRDNVSAIVVKL